MRRDPLCFPLPCWICPCPGSCFLFSPALDFLGNRLREKRGKSDLDLAVRAAPRSACSSAGRRAFFRERRQAVQPVLRQRIRPRLPPAPFSSAGPNIEPGLRDHAFDGFRGRCRPEILGIRHAGSRGGPVNYLRPLQSWARTIGRVVGRNHSTDGSISYSVE